MNFMEDMVVMGDMVVMADVSNFVMLVQFGSLGFTWVNFGSLR